MLWDHTDGKYQPHPGGNPVSPGLSDCLPIDSTHLICGITLPGFVETVLVLKNLRGDGPSILPLHSYHKPSLGDIEPHGSSLVPSLCPLYALGLGYPFTFSVPFIATLILPHSKLDSDDSSSRTFPCLLGCL